MLFRGKQVSPKCDREILEHLLHNSIVPYVLLRTANIRLAFPEVSGVGSRHASRESAPPRPPLWESLRTEQRPLPENAKKHHLLFSLRRPPSLFHKNIKSPTRTNASRKLPSSLNNMGCAIEPEQPSLSAWAREQSLRRSLSAIHRLPQHRRVDGVAPVEHARTDERQESLASDLPFPADAADAPPASRDGRCFPSSPFPDAAVAVSAALSPASRPRCRGYRGDYALGDTVRALTHMLVPPSAAHAARASRSLRVNDFAFVKRSDGSFSYGILAYRCRVPFRRHAKDAVVMEECLVFAVSGDGATKMVREKQGAAVRLVAPMASRVDGAATRLPGRKATGSREALEKCPRTVSAMHPKEKLLWLPHLDIAPPAPCQAVTDNDWVRPSMVSFVPQMDDDCSVLSSVSERARRC